MCARGDFLPRDQSHPAFVTLPHQLKTEAANTGWVVGDESRWPPLSLGLVPDQKAQGAALWAAVATVFVCSWGSKLVTVSFHLWSWSLSSCWEEEPPCWEGRGSPSPYRGLGTPVRLGEDAWRRAFCHNLWVTMTTRHINASLCFASGSGMFVFTNVFTAGVRHMS